jgi:hypothetical protein
VGRVPSRGWWSGDKIKIIVSSKLAFVHRSWRPPEAEQKGFSVHLDLAGHSFHQGIGSGSPYPSATETSRPTCYYYNIVSSPRSGGHAAFHYA